MLCHETIENLMTMNFQMVQHHKYSFTELENMMPWERTIYVELLAQHVEDENRKLKELEKKHGR